MKTSFQFQEQFKDELGRVAAFLGKIAEEGLEDHKIKTGGVFAGPGKMIRPSLFFLMMKAENCAIDNDSIKMAGSIELMHQASLIHDDIVDESMLRRGDKAMHLKVGNRNSVLIGDYLFSACLLSLLAIGGNYVAAACRALNLLCVGQMKQVTNRGNTGLSREDYMDIIYQKTSPLFELAANMASEKSGSENSAGWVGYARELGAIYQIADDYTELMRHESPEDVKSGDMTLPLILLREKIGQRKFADVFDISCLESLREMIEKHGIGSIIRDEIALRKNRALACLPQTEEITHVFKSALVELQGGNIS